MPRSSRHKSSKHGSRDARDYSESEDDSGSRERRGGGDDSSARQSKDSAFTEKRRLDSTRDAKDAYGPGNGDHSEDHGSVKRRKEKFTDGVSDRWNGGDEAGPNRAKSSSDSKSRRREDESEEGRRSGKSERHRESSRKEREVKYEKVDEKLEIATDTRATVALETDNILERGIRKRRESFDDGRKYLDDVEDSKDRSTYSGDDASRGAKQKNEKTRDERHRDKYRDERDKDSKNGSEKQKDDYPAKERNGSRSNEKYMRDEKDIVEIRSKKSKPHDNDRDIERSREHDRYRDRDRDKDRDRDNARDWDRNLDWDRDRDGDRERVQDRASTREKERDRDWERGGERDRDPERDRDFDRDRDDDDRSVRYKDLRGKKRSPEECDDYHDSKSRDGKARSSIEKKSLSSTRGDMDDRSRSQTRQVHLDNILGSGRSRASPISSPHGGIDEYSRQEKEDDSKFPSKEIKSRAISPRESAGISGHADRDLKYTTFDKHGKLDDGHFREFSTERLSGSKASPRGLTERSPSTTSLDRSRSLSRPGVRRNLDSEEAARRGDGRDFPVNEGRLNRELSVGRPSAEDSSQADAPYNIRSGPSNSSSHIPPQPPRRNNDGNFGRGHGNNWRGVPNWSPALANGFIPFQHGPPHGNFPAMMSHFPAAPLFSVRPPMDMNQSGLPYPIADADRFSGHFRPIGWQNMIDASGLPRFRGWEGTGGLLREDHHLFQGPDWDQNRHLMNMRGWEPNSDPWKGQNGEFSADLPSASRKEDYPALIPAEDSNQLGREFTGSNTPNANVRSKSSGEQEELPSFDREVKSSALKVESDKPSDSSKSREANVLEQLSSAYLCKLDISPELADPELYKQCLTLVGGEPISTGDDNPSMHTVLEDDHGKAMELSHGSSRVLFPAIDDCVFQKAINHYAKQRHEPWSSFPLVNLEFLNVDPSTDGDRANKGDLVSTEKKDEVAKDIDEQMPDVSVSEGEVKVETLIASSGQQNTVDIPVISGDKECPVISGKTLPNDALGENETAGGYVDYAGAVVAAIVADSGSIATVSCPLGVDGSCGEGLNEASMPSNESKLANLSRIHQSTGTPH